MNKKIDDAFITARKYFIDIEISEDDFKKKTIQECMHMFSREAEDYRSMHEFYSLESLLMMALLAKTCWKCESFLEMARWLHLKRKWLKKIGIIKGDRTPSHDTIRRLFILFSFEKISKAIFEAIDKLYENVRKKAKSAKSDTVKLVIADGKEIRGSGRKDNTENPHKNLGTLNIYDVSSRQCFMSIGIDKKESEIGVLQKALRTMNLRRKCISCDALHTQVETAKIIIEGHGEYVLPVKSNQASLEEEITARFNDKGKGIGVYKTFERDKRSFEAITLNNRYIGCEFPGQRTYIKMHSTTHGKNSECNMLFVSSVKDPELAIDVIEKRWMLEQFHYDKDNLLYEDYGRSENKAIVTNMAILNSIIIAFYKVVMSIMGFKSPSDARVFLGVEPEESFSLVFSAMDERSLSTAIRRCIKRKDLSMN